MTERGERRVFLGILLAGVLVTGMLSFYQVNLTSKLNTEIRVNQATTEAFCTLFSNSRIASNVEIRDPLRASLNELAKLLTQAANSPGQTHRAEALAEARRFTELAQQVTPAMRYQCGVPRAP